MRKWLLGDWETRDINWKKKESFKLQGKSFLPLGQSSTGTGYPEWLCIFIHGRLKKPLSNVVWCHNWPWTNFGLATSQLAQFWTSDLQRSLTTWITLILCTVCPQTWARSDTLAAITSISTSSEMLACAAPRLLEERRRNYLWFSHSSPRGT